MSKLNVIDFNYITSGCSEKLFNLNISYDKYDQDGIALGTEDQQRNTLVYQNNHFFKLNTIKSKKCDKFNSLADIKNITFVAGIDQDNDKFTPRGNSNRFSLYDKNNNVIIHPLYDLKDICVKSQIKKSKSSTTPETHSSNEYVDIYAPSISSDSCSICQIGDYSYVLTERMENGPLMLETDLDIQRDNQNPSDIKETGYTFQLVQQTEDTYLYDSSDNDKKDISSYYDVKYNLKNIKYNYIIEIPQNFDNNLIRNDYKNGDIQGDVVKCKNAYDSTYSMKMKTQTEIDNTRNYIGIGNCGEDVFLKYYDNISYHGIKATDTNGIREIEMVQREPNGYPYQKVETVKSINRFKSSSKHNSNLYSVSIRNTGLEQLEQSGNKDLMEKLKMNIKNNVRSICKQLSPANTHLFDVYFDGETNT